MRNHCAQGRLYLTCKLKCIACREICVGGGDGKDDTVWVVDVEEDELTDEFFNVVWLISNRDLSESGGEERNEWRKRMRGFVRGDTADDSI